MFHSMKGRRGQIEIRLIWILFLHLESGLKGVVEGAVRDSCALTKAGMEQYISKTTKLLLQRSTPIRNEAIRQLGYSVGESPSSPPSDVCNRILRRVTEALIHVQKCSLRQLIRGKYDRSFTLEMALNMSVSLKEFLKDYPDNRRGKQMMSNNDGVNVSLSCTLLLKTFAVDTHLKKFNSLNLTSIIDSGIFYRYKKANDGVPSVDMSQVCFRLFPCTHLPKPKPFPPGPYHQSCLLKFIRIKILPNFTVNRPQYVLVFTGILMGYVLLIFVNGLTVVVLHRMGKDYQFNPYVSHYALVLCDLLVILCSIPLLLFDHLDIENFLPCTPFFIYFEHSIVPTIIGLLTADQFLVLLIIIERWVLHHQARKHMNEDGLQQTLSELDANGGGRSQSSIQKTLCMEWLKTIFACLFSVTLCVVLSLSFTRRHISLSSLKTYGCRYTSSDKTQTSKAIFYAFSALITLLLIILSQMLRISYKRSRKSTTAEADEQVTKDQMDLVNLGGAEEAPNTEADRGSHQNGQRDHGDDDDGNDQTMSGDGVALKKSIENSDRTASAIITAEALLAFCQTFLTILLLVGHDFKNRRGLCDRRRHEMDERTCSTAEQTLLYLEIGTYAISAFEIVSHFFFFFILSPTFRAQCRKILCPCSPVASVSTVHPT